MYADIGPSPGEGLCCKTMLQFQDDKVEYAEVKSPIHEPEQSVLNPSQSPGTQSTYLMCALLSLCDIILSYELLYKIITY